MAQNPPTRWEGKISETLTLATADQIWPLFKDFFNFHKWFPTLSTCYGISGINGEVGCIRYCSGFSIPSNDGGDHVTPWSKERLTVIDDERCRISYEIVDSNIGFNSYVSTITIAPRGNGGENGTVIEWSFAVEPVGSLVLEDLVEKYESGLRCMARRMEVAMRQPTVENLGK